MKSTSRVHGVRSMLVVALVLGGIALAHADAPPAPTLLCTTSRGEMPWNQYLAFVSSRTSFGDDYGLLDPIAPAIEAFRTPDVEVVVARDVMLSRASAIVTVQSALGTYDSAWFLERGEATRGDESSAGRLDRVLGMVDGALIAVMCQSFTQLTSCAPVRIAEGARPVTLAGDMLPFLADAIVFRTARGFTLVGLGEHENERTVDEIDLTAGRYTRRVVTQTAAALGATLRGDRITFDPEPPSSARACGPRVGEVRTRVRMGVTLDGEAQIHADEITVTRVTSLDARGACETRYEAASSLSYWYGIGLRVTLDAESPGVLRSRFGVAEVRCETSP